MSSQRVYADFQNLDDSNRVRLTCAGTMNDLTRQSIELREGLVLTFYMDDADDQGDSDELRGGRGSLRRERRLLGRICRLVRDTSRFGWG